MKLIIRPGQFDSQFIVTARMLLNAPACNFIIGILDWNTLIEQSLCSNRAISCTMKYEKWPPTRMAFWNIYDDKQWINLAWPKECVNEYCSWPWNGFWHFVDQGKIYGMKPCLQFGPKISHKAYNNEIHTTQHHLTMLQPLLVDEHQGQFVETMPTQ